MKIYFNAFICHDTFFFVTGKKPVERLTDSNLFSAGLTKRVTVHFKKYGSSGSKARNLFKKTFAFERKSVSPSKPNII